METVEYSPARLIDLYGDPAHPSVLIWHGSQTDARATLSSLAGLLVGHGLGVLVPDWNSHADDGGRADLLASVEFARRHVVNPDGLVLVGWSMGGVAAAGLTVHAQQHNVRFRHTVCLAGAFMVRDPISRELVTTGLPGHEQPSAFTLLHGGADDVIPVDVSREFAAALDDNGWPVEFAELAADHGSIAGATYDPAADRYSVSADPATLAIAADVAERIASVA